MDEKKLNGHISALENMLKEFKDAREKGKETNKNDVRAQSIEEIEAVTQRLEQYLRNNADLLQNIAGSRTELATKINWNDIVRPGHFEEDLREEIDKLKNRAS